MLVKNRCRLCSDATPIDAERLVGPNLSVSTKGHRSLSALHLTHFMPLSFTAFTMNIAVSDNYFSMATFYITARIISLAIDILMVRK